MQFPIVTFLDPEANLKRVKKNLFLAAIFSILLKVISSSPPTIPTNIKISSMNDVLLHYLITSGLQSSCGVMAIITIYLFLLRAHLTAQTEMNCDEKQSDFVFQSLTEKEKNFSTTKDASRAFIKMLIALIMGPNFPKPISQNTPSKKSYLLGRNIVLIFHELTLSNVIKIAPTATAIFAIYICRTNILSLFKKIQLLL